MARTSGTGLRYGTIFLLSGCLVSCILEAKKRLRCFSDSPFFLLARARSPRQRQNALSPFLPSKPYQRSLRRHDALQHRIWHNHRLRPCGIGRHGVLVKAD
jgi:hypothetical protein